MFPNKRFLLFIFTAIFILTFFSACSKPETKIEPEKVSGDLNAVTNIPVDKSQETESNTTGGIDESDKMDEIYEIIDETEQHTDDNQTIREIPSETTHSATNPSAPPIIEVSSVNISDKNIFMNKNGTYSLTASVLPSNAANQTLKWASSNPSVVSVKSGILTALSAGSAVITVKSGNGKTAQCSVTVTSPVESVAFNSAQATVNRYDSYNLNATVYPADATNQTLTYTTSNSNVATVSGSGTVYAAGAGTAVITATSDNGLRATFEITVTVSVQSINIKADQKEINKGVNFNVVVEIIPSDAEDKSFSLSSSNENILRKTNDGWLAVGGGTAELTAVAANGVRGNITISVIVPVESVALDLKEKEMDIGDSVTLKATVYPADATDKKIRFTTSNDRVVTVSDNGKIDAVGSGKATVTCTVAGISASCAVIVDWSGYVTKSKSVSFNTLDIECSVNSVGSYINWAGISNVCQFKDVGGNFYFAYYTDSDIIISKTSADDKIVSKITIKKSYPVFGAATCDNNGNFYIVWGKNDDSDNIDTDTVFVSKYNSAGSLVSTVSFKGITGGNGEGNTKYPFSCSSCDVKIIGDTLICQYGKQRYDGHQQSDVIAVRISDMTKLDETLFDPWTSHSFRQKILHYAKSNYVIFAELGDCFPRGFHISVFQPDGTECVNDFITFNCWVEKGAFDRYDMWQVNRTRAKLGNILETQNGAILIGSSVKSLSENAQNEPQNVFIQIFDPLSAGDADNGYFTEGVRSGVAGYNGDSPVTDYGVKWITNYSGDKSVTEVQAVTIDNGRILVLYEVSDGESFYLILNSKGEIVHQAESMGKTKLNTDEDPVFCNGYVKWIQNRNTINNLRIFSIDCMS